MFDILLFLASIGITAFVVLAFVALVVLAQDARAFLRR